MAKGRQRTLRNGLTPKENALKNKVLEQIASGQPVNGTEAAVQVYDVSSRKSASKIASEVLSKPDVREQIEIALNSQGLSIDVIMGEMKKIAVAEAPKISGDVKLRSLVELMKLSGGYPSKKSTSISFNFSGKMKKADFSEAKGIYDSMNSEVGELVGDSQ